MATVGQQLVAPESGWQRIDDNDLNITYSGSGWIMNPSYSPFGGNKKISSSLDAVITFNFTGTKLRLIGALSTNWSDILQIEIDDIIVETFSQYSSNIIGQVLNYEKLNLSALEHFVKITNKSNGYIGLDAIDIDETGTLKPYNPITTNLTATAGDSQVTLSWDAVSGVSGYNVKRSTTAGGPYITIATNVTDINYIDNTVTNGTTYYFVVTAVNESGIESANSNEASATPQAPSGYGLLRVTMNDSSEREYQLSTTEIDGFINWVKGHVSTDPNCYMLNKIEVLQNSKEYLMFEKIISFEVMELTK
jgi:hypothetical protein